MKGTWKEHERKGNWIKIDRKNGELRIIEGKLYENK